jgi:hypothetical protein
LDFPAHEAYRKELRKGRRKQLEREFGEERGEELEKRLWYDPSSTLSLVRKWGSSTRNIVRSMEYAALGVCDPIENDALSAARDICNDPTAISEIGTETTTMPRSKGSSVLFLRRTLNASVSSGRGKTFIPTPHLLAIFQEQYRKK